MMARFKQISFVFIFISISFIAGAQKSEDILMTVGNIPVSVGEFKYIYEKNNGKEANYSKASIDEYLDLYTKFKLKVNEARSTKLDTITSLQEELEGYKRQLASSYIMDKGVNDYLLNELKERIKKDVKFSHIFVAIPNGADDSVVAAKKKTIDEAYERLQAGAPFENMVRFFSEDKLTSEAGGDMGFFTAMMPNGFYEFESMLYNTPIGKYSKPVRSRIGWHIIKVTEERPARGEVEVAHILVRKSTDPAGDKTKIENIYSQLQNGGNWENLAATLSEDEQSSRGGGLLPVFGINTYERNFEDAAFALKTPGSYSKPLETRAGWHILKLVRNHDPLDDDNFKKYYEQRIKNDDRYAKTKTSLLSNIRQASNFKEDLALLQKFGAGLDDEFYTFKWEPKSSDLMGNTLMAFDDNNKYTLSDFATYAQKNTRIRLRYDKTVNSIEEPINALYEAFKEEKTIAFEQGNLEKKYPDFKSLMREYEEGILLFEVTKNAVWDRANQDTVGLANYFSKNRNKYMNEERLLGEKITIKTNDAAIAAKIYKDGKKKSGEKLAKKYNVDSEVLTYEPVEILKSDKESEKIPWKKKTITPMESINGSDTYSFTRIEKIMPASQKSLKDSRGYVVADYQDQLEKDWVAALKAKYKVQVKNDILQKIVK